jgi:hypothetical protein
MKIVGGFAAVGLLVGFLGGVSTSFGEPTGTGFCIDSCSAPSGWTVVVLVAIAGAVVGSAAGALAWAVWTLANGRT